MSEWKGMAEWGRNLPFFIRSLASWRRWQKQCWWFFDTEAVNRKKASKNFPHFPFPPTMHAHNFYHPTKHLHRGLLSSGASQRRKIELKCLIVCFISCRASGAWEDKRDGDKRRKRRISTKWMRKLLKISQLSISINCSLGVKLSFFSAAETFHIAQNYSSLELLFVTSRELSSLRAPQSLERTITPEHCTENIP